MNLIQYVASYGDLLPPAEPEAKHSSTTQRAKVSCDANICQHYILAVSRVIRTQLECVF